MYTYLLVFIMKLINGGLSNYRLLLMKEGNKISASLTTVFATLTWTIAMAFVVGNFKEDPFIVLPFVLGVVGGNYLGIMIDNYFKSGSILTTIILNDKNRQMLLELKAENFSVTSFIGKGMNDKKEIIMITSPRKRSATLFNILKNNGDENFIISEKVEEIL